MSEPSIDGLLAVAHEMADAARPVPMRYFRKKVPVETKDDASPVTIADRETELAMRAVLDRHFPDHGVFGEEHGQARLESRFVWVLDPIDGTRSFIAGMPLFGTMIAVLDQGVPVVGIVDSPALAERYVGVKGRPSTFNGEEIHTASTDRLDRALLFPAEHGEPPASVRQSFERAKAAAREHRYGYDCYIYAQLAAGHIDAIIENGLAPYDFLALVPLIEGAGGRVTDWHGHPLSLQSSEFVAAAATPTLHRELLGLLDTGA
jgi:histidinol phosphatase-like enzyme (inositol monophosphatase family)